MTYKLQKMLSLTMRIEILLKHIQGVGTFNKSRGHATLALTQRNKTQQSRGGHLRRIPPGTAYGKYYYYY